MAATQPKKRTRLLIELEPGLRRAIESAASHSGVSVEDYVVGVLRHNVSPQTQSGTRSPTMHRQELAGGHTRGAQREDQNILETATIEALRRKRHLTLEDVIGVLPPLGIPVDEMIRLAKEERALRIMPPDAGDRGRR